MKENFERVQTNAKKKVKEQMERTNQLGDVGISWELEAESGFSSFSTRFANKNSYNNDRKVPFIPNLDG